MIFLLDPIVLTIALLLFHEPLLKLYGASGQSLTQTVCYGTFLFLGLFAFMFANGASGILRGQGDVKRAMYVVIVPVILNAILNLILWWGVVGAAITTILSSICAAIIILYWILIKKDTSADVNLRKFSFNSKIANDILKVGRYTIKEIRKTFEIKFT